MLIGDLESALGEGGRSDTRPGDFERIDESNFGGARVVAPRVEVVRVLVLVNVDVEEGPRIEVVLALILEAGIWDAPPRAEVVFVRCAVGIDDGVPGLRGVDMLDREPETAKCERCGV